MLKAIIVGNIGSEPEMRYSAQGQGMLRFSVASNDRVKNQDGEWQDETTWIRCTVFGARAEKLSEMLRKGTKVFVDGRLEARPWLNNSGQPMAGLEMIANDVEFAGNRQDVEQRQPIAAGRQVTPAEAQRMDEAGELPF